MKTTVEAALATTDGAAAARSMAVHWVFPDTSGSRVTRLTGTPKTVGRTQPSDTVLPGDQVSRCHAEFRRSGPVYLVRDLQSKNGVYLNGERVTQAAFTVGDVLRIGEWIGVALEAAEEETLLVEELDSGIVGSVVLRRVMQGAKNAARSELPIVLQGETGTGKERLAHAIHAWSSRTGRFLAVNCANYPEQLAAAQLFGYKKGAFTGADRSASGHVIAADRGTLFLDEVAELPLTVQAQLLRVVEQREVLSLGDSQATRVDVRFVSAVQDPLADLVARQRFRADLRARLEGVVIECPPLRERRSDIPFLCEYFSRKYAIAEPPQLGASLVEHLCSHDWPGNVRELELLLRRILALFPNEQVLKLSQVGDLVKKALDPVSAESSAQLSASAARKDSPYSAEEIAGLQAALERSGGNLTRAATELGITRGKAYRLLSALRGGR